MCRISEVPTGAVRIRKGNCVLKTGALGSCIAVIAADSTKTIGGIAHVMLPGRSPIGRKKRNCRYAEDAIEELLGKMIRQGACKSRLQIGIVGGANVLRKKDEKLCKQNIDSVTKKLREEGLKIRKASVGGMTRRCAMLDIGKREARYSVGTRRESILFSFRKCEGGTN